MLLQYVETQFADLLKSYHRQRLFSGVTTETEYPSGKTLTSLLLNPAPQFLKWAMKDIDL